MIELVIASDDFTTIQSELTAGAVEGCAVLFANETARADGTIRLLVREIEYPASDEYISRGKLDAELTPSLVARVAKRAQKEGYTIVFVHSHPGIEAPRFSQIDDDGEQHLSKFLNKRVPRKAHGALVVSAGGVRARRLGTEEEVRVVSLGTKREVLFDPDATITATLGVFDRQVRAFGADGQRALQRLRIAVIGLGGTGSIVTQELVHLGVQNFILIDPDVLEETNLNRVANALPSDLGRPKVEIASRYIKCIAEKGVVEAIVGDIIRVRTAEQLLNADIIFCCTDSHGSRAVVQQVSYQYMIPCIDMGTTIAVAKGRVTHIYGRVQLLAPGLGCLTCSNLLNPAEVRRDMMTAFERQQDPYLQGVREPAPAVMSLNGTVASISVTMLLAMATGLPMNGRYILYNAINSSLRTARANLTEDCYICSRKGSFARGNTWPLLGRQD